MITTTLDANTDRLDADDERRDCCGRRVENCDCDAPPAEVHNARALRAARQAQPIKPFVSMFAELSGELTHEGYSAWIGFDEDADILAGLDCTKCGRHGLSYYAYRQIGRQRTSYRPLAVCDDCGYTFEF